MSQCILPVLVLASLLFSPLSAEPMGPKSTPPALDSPSFISDFFNRAKTGDEELIRFQLGQIASMMEQSETPLSDSRRFLLELVNQCNAQFNTSFTLPHLLDLTRESIALFTTPDVSIDTYLLGLNLIDPTSHFYFSKDTKSKNNVWTWLTVATVAAAAVTVCIVLPQMAPAVIGGAVAVGKAAFDK